MPRVVALTHVFPRAVADANAPFLLTWATALREAGVEVAVVAPHDAGLPLRHVVGGVPVRLARYAPQALERLAYRGEMHQLIRRPWAPPALAGLLASLAVATRSLAAHADVVHVHWWMPGALALRLAGVGVPAVATVHGTDVALVEARPWLAPLARWALAACDRVEAVSADLAERLERALGRRADAIAPMPLCPEALRAPPGDTAGPPAERRALQVLAAGRMVPEKGFADLVSAAAAVQGAGQPVELVIVGEGPERESLRHQARAEGVSLGLPGRLPPDALRRAYARADVVCVPSHREGFGLVACEAVCAGTPVVATDSGGARDVFDREALVAVGDVDALAAALADVAAAPRAARQRAAHVAERVRRRLSPAAAAERAQAAYRALGVG